MGRGRFKPVREATEYADFGGARRDRTADLLHAMQALSQLSYGPTRGRRTLRSRPLLVKASPRGTSPGHFYPPPSTASMRARARSRPRSSSVASIGGETA